MGFIHSKSKTPNYIFKTKQKKMTKIIVIFISLISLNLSLLGQATPFNIMLEPVNISELGGLHSYAVGQHDGKWLIIGGRLDGLHQRQPFAAFDAAGNNNQLIVVDPIAEQKWSAPLSSLPIAMQEQLSSTNMEFYQEGDYLYFLGGYGYSASLGDHTTYPNLTAINVPDVIDAVINDTNFTSFFRQINDPVFQVTGGRLKKIGSNYYLLGGQKFLGRYNPMGPDHGPGFIQEYTDAVSVFSLTDDGITVTVNHLPSYSDTENLHRRDYNAEPQIMPNGEEGITMFSGVFQPLVDLPFLNSVDIDANGYTVNNDFQQYYNHYHCPALPLYSATNNEMHTVFFGGIAQFYDNNGTLVQDDDVPFVKTIARVTRDQNGSMIEYKLPIEMPTLLGAGAEFIPNKNIPHYSNEVFMLDEITSDSTLMGYIYGGISSTAPNIFFSNTGDQSSANNQIFKVYLTQGSPLSVNNLNPRKGTLQIEAWPNPNYGTFMILFNLTENTDVKLMITDIKGQVLVNPTLENQVVGENFYLQKGVDFKSGHFYFLTIETPYEKATRKIFIE